MIMLTPWGTYSLFMALRNHFTSESYDFIKYHGKTRTSRDSFNRLEYQYTKLSKKVDANVMTDYIVANLLRGKTYVGDFIDSEAYDVFTDYTRRRQSLTYLVSKETEDLVAEAGSAASVFRVSSGTYTPVLHQYLSGRLSPESLVVLNYFVGFTNQYDTKFGKNDIIWAPIRLMLRKYPTFFQFDKPKMKKVMQEKLLNKENV